jgi:hypothetical protein
MGPDEFHQHAAERVRDVDHEPVLVAAEVEYHAVIADEIDAGAVLGLDVVRRLPARPAREREPHADRPFGLRVTLPELAQGPAGDHLHVGKCSMSPYW